MLNQNHPDDERLSALAANEADATADGSLTAHVAACDRCTGLVNELGSLRTSLAALPDVTPPRPLRLLPEVEPELEPVGAGVGGWVRRFFAPVLTTGAAIAMVGLVGTAAPALSGMGSGQAAGPLDEVFRDVGNELQGGAQAEASDFEQAPAESIAITGEGDQFFSASDAPRRAVEDAQARGGETGDGQDDEQPAAQLPAERSPWPMVLFTGVAIMVGAALLRWILVPRAG